MFNPIESIFYEWIEERDETVDTVQFCSNFCNKNGADWALAEILEKERKDAFESGFRIAVSLILKV